MVGAIGHGTHTHVESKCLAFLRGGAVRGSLRLRVSTLQLLFIHFNFSTRHSVRKAVWCSGKRWYGPTSRQTRGDFDVLSAQLAPLDQRPRHDFHLIITIKVTTMCN